MSSSWQWLNGASAAVEGAATRCVTALRAGTAPDGSLNKAMLPDEQVVVGWASVVADAAGRPIVDLQNDIIDLTDLQSAARAFLKSNDRKLDVDHDGKARGEVVEGLVVTPEVKKALGLPPETPLGFIVAAKVHDAGTWAKVRSGQLRMFSIGGSATRLRA